MQELQQIRPTYELINKDSLLSLSNELASLIKEKKLSTNIQGTVTATGGGGDMTLDNTSIATGQQVKDLVAA